MDENGQKNKFVNDLFNPNNVARSIITARKTNFLTIDFLAIRGGFI